MDIDVLKTFLEVNRTRHFGKAAEQLFVTQSTVSSRIKQLEESIGAAVFIRQRNDIQLTPAGERLKRYAENILTTWNRARQEIVIDDETHQSLSIAGVPSLWDITLQHWLQRVTKSHRDVVFQAEVIGQEAIRRRLLDNTVDIGFVFEAPQLSGFTFKEISTVSLVLVSSHKNASVEKALSSNYILVDWGTSFAIAHAKNFPDLATPFLRVGLGRIAKEYILANGGSAYLAQPMIKNELEQGRLHYVEGGPVIERSAYAVYAEGSDKTALIKNLLKKI